MNVKLIDWWLAKTPEERQSVLEADNTSDTVRANIAALEAYCRAHPYRVFCDSALRPRPFPPRLLPPIPPPPPDVPVLCGATTVGIGGRCSRPEARVAAAAAAAECLAAVRDRVGEFLGKEGGRGKDLVAGLVVRVMAEATTAALQRTGATAAIEVREAAVARQRQQRPALVLNLARSGAKAVVVAVAPDTGKPVASPPLAVRAAPIAAHADRAVSLLGLWGLLSRRATLKRPRGAGHGSGLWGLLRESAAEALPAPTHEPKQAAAAAAEGGGGQALLPPGIEITGKDMQFALHKVASLPEFRELFGELP